MLLMDKWRIKDSILSFKGIVLRKNEYCNCWRVQSGSHEWPGENWQDILCSVKGRTQRDCRKLLNKLNTKLYFFPMRIFFYGYMSVFAFCKEGGDESGILDQKLSIIPASDLAVSSSYMAGLTPAKAQD